MSADEGIDGDKLDGFVEDGVGRGVDSELGTKDGSLRRPRRAAGWEGSRRRARSRKCGLACPGVVSRTLIERTRGSRLSRSIRECIEGLDDRI